MASALKIPSNRRESNIWQDSKTGRWKWEIELRRRDGTTFRKGGSRKAEKEARKSRDKAYAEFNRNEGRNQRATPSDPGASIAWTIFGPTNSPLPRNPPIGTG